MKKTRGIQRVLLIAVATLILSGAHQPAYCADSSSTTSVSISLQTIFSIEFYTDANVLFSTTVPFTNVDPKKSIIYPDGRSENDGKSDTAVICSSNTGKTWYLKLHAQTAPPLTVDKVKYYISQPYNRNTGATSDGTLTRTPEWYPLAAEPTTIYTSGYKDMSNLPFGTIVTFSFSLIPTDLESGKTYSAAITYTLTTSS